MPEFRQATGSAATRTVLVMNGASWITNNIMISSSRENDPIIDGPLALCLFAFAFDYTPWTITPSEAAVAWRSAFAGAYDGDPYAMRDCFMLGNSAIMSLWRGHCPSTRIVPLCYAVFSL